MSIGNTIHPGLHCDNVSCFSSQLISHSFPSYREGGGGCGLDNLRTLCVPCHQVETEKLRSRLKLAGPTEEDHGKDLASSAKKRKQLDIRQSLASNTTTRKSKRKK